MSSNNQHNIPKQTLVVLGASESGVGAAFLGKTKGYEVFVSDKGMIKAEYLAKLQAQNIPYEEGRHSLERILQADLVVKSPGIPNHIALIQEIKAKGIPIISEIEFASQHTNATLIAITGSNGKTTTTSLVYHVLKAAGFNVGLAGNIGYSFAKQVATQTYDYYVLEISSFQLDDIEKFQPHISILLNITPDHLDRYEYSLEKYAQAKFKIAENQTKDDFFIYCADDELVNNFAKDNSNSVNTIAFSLNKELTKGAFFDKQNKNIHLQIKKQAVNGLKISKNDLQHSTESLSIIAKELTLKGKHNLYNIMAAGLAAQLLGVIPETIAATLKDFNSLEHRLESVAVIDNVEFINDSKATNIDAVWYALDAMSKPIIWMVGGVDKGNDYSILAQLVQEKVTAIVCLGVDNSKIHQAFDKQFANIIDTNTAEKAVRAAFDLAKGGEVVLLSPACASFDLFNNYKDRGKQFKAAVYDLQAVVS